MLRWRPARVTVLLSTFHIKSILAATPTRRILRLRLEATRFSFHAGQAVMLGAHGHGLRKPYSIASSPEEARARNQLDFLIKVDAHGSGGPHLGHLRRGLPVDVEGPFGNFQFPAGAAEREVLFIAGGTGIAPIRSMLMHALETGWSGHATLMYSARSPRDFAYAKEFRRLAREKKIVLALTVTRDTGARWRGHQGRVDRKRIAALLEDPAATLCFVCGPPALVADVPPMLRELGVADARIRLED